MRLGIRFQLLLPLLALMLGLVGGSAWSAWASGQRARAQIEMQIHDIAATLNARPFALNTQIFELMKGLSGAEFLLCDAGREPIRDEEGKLIATLADVPDTLPDASESPTQHFDRPVHAGGASYLCGGVRLKKTRPGAIVYILYPESLMREAAWQAAQPALTLGIVGTVLALALSVLLAQQLGRRIGALERRTRLIAGGDFSPMPLPAVNDELRDLGKSINEMAQRLAHFQETIRQTERLRLLGQVSGGLAHQLRNGVAGARLAVQLHAQDCEVTQDREALDVALRQLSLVEMHLKRFLDLGKAVTLAKHPCNLADIVRDTIQLLGPQCRHVRLDVRVPADSGTVVPLDGDPGQLGQLFLNLLTNAIEAAGPGGWIEVRWGTSNQRAFVEIRDSGPGPTPEVAARLFEPFATGKQEGVGLGLAVARQIAIAHGGTITWSRAANATCFRVEL